MRIPWPGTALNMARDINTSIPELFIKCFHDYPTVEELSAFMFHSSMKDIRDSTVEDNVLHEVNKSLEEDREPHRAGPWDRLWQPK